MDSGITRLSKPLDQTTPHSFVLSIYIYLTLLTTSYLLPFAKTYVGAAGVASRSELETINLFLQGQSYHFFRHPDPTPTSIPV